MREPTRRGGRRGRPIDTEGFPRRGPARRRRGDVRGALLIALVEGPSHGYDLMQLLETKTEGRWRPSPGAVYPALQQLADEGLVTVNEHDGKRVYTLTDEGRADADRRLA